MKKHLLLIFKILVVVSGLRAQQTGSVSGKITDKKDQSELIGVTVLIQGTKFGTATGPDGRFSIRNIKQGEYTLEITYIGYKKMILTRV